MDTNEIILTPAWVIVDPTGNWILVIQGLPAPQIRAFGVTGGMINLPVFQKFWSERPTPPPYSMEQCATWLLGAGYIEGEVTLQMAALTLANVMEMLSRE